jgi:CHAT domain-containing protein
VLRGKIALDDAFTRQTLRTALTDQPPVVHIASHFIFDPVDARKSFLLLGDGAHYTLSDIQDQANIFAGVQLLTLSACNTGVGGLSSDGSELDDLGTLMQLKGAKAVIATLWPIADSSTSVLMREFYRIRQSHPGVAKLDALRQAQLELLHSDAQIFTQVTARRSARRGVKLENPEPPAAGLSHPFYWAAFFLMGNWL